MLVLVNLRISIARPLVGVSLLILMIFGTPLSALAQAGGSNTTSNSVSVLVKPGTDDSGIGSPAANSAAAIQSSSATLTVRQNHSNPAFPQRPSPPRELLVPQSPAARASRRRSRQSSGQCCNRFIRFASCSFYRSWYAGNNKSSSAKSEFVSKRAPKSPCGSTDQESRVATRLALEHLRFLLTHFQVDQPQPSRQRIAQPQAMLRRQPHPFLRRVHGVDQKPATRIKVRIVLLPINAQLSQLPSLQAHVSTPTQIRLTTKVLIPILLRAFPVWHRCIIFSQTRQTEIALANLFEGLNRVSIEIARFSWLGLLSLRGREKLIRLKPND